MVEYRDVDQYEKDFLKKYIVKKAMNEIAKLKSELNDADQTKRVVIQHKIKKIREELEQSKRLVEKMEEEEQKQSVIEYKLHKAMDSFVHVLEKNITDSSDSCFNTVVERITKIEQLYMDYFQTNDFMSHFMQNNKLIVSKDSEKHGVPITSIYCPQYVYEFLLPFQRISLKWFGSLFMNNRGGILADEMGLGKTVQAIAFISSLFYSNIADGAIILCPSTLLKQWFVEIQKIYPFAQIILLHNNFLRNVDRTLSSENHGANTRYYSSKTIIIASYDGFKCFFKKIRRLKIDLLILDEGHKIKNFNTQIFKYIKNYNNTTYILTGTPVQNNLKELWSLFNITNAHLLGSYIDFRCQFEDVILKGTLKKATMDEKKQGKQRMEYLKSLISPYILRRTKNSADLPKKHEKVVSCPMTKEQLFLYEEFIKSKTVCDIIRGKRNVLYGIIVLRKITNHPYLLTKDKSGKSGKMHMLEALLSEWHTENIAPSHKKTKSSAKFDLAEMKNKVLIFSQSIEMLDIIETHINYKKYKYLRMDGTTILTVRSKYIESFSEQDYFIFLLTTRIGGIGLNLTAANKIVIYDPDWNPSVDKQASERSYRFGQKKDVEIFRFITKGTIEDKIYEKQIFKSLLAGRVLGDKIIDKLFNTSDLRELFTLGDYITEGLVKNEDKNINSQKNNDDGTAMEYVEEKILTGHEMLEFIKKREHTC